MKKLLDRVERFCEEHRVAVQLGLVVCAAMTANGALADVAGALNSAGTGMSGWAQAGGTAAAVFCGLRIATGHYLATIPMGAGVVTAAQPQDVTGWLGLG